MPLYEIRDEKISFASSRSDVLAVIADFLNDPTNELDKFEIFNYSSNNICNSLRGWLPTGKGKHRKSSNSCCFEDDKNWMEYIHDHDYADFCGLNRDITKP